MLKKVIKFNLKIIGGIVIGLIALQVISAYFFGIMAEKQFEFQFKKLTDSQFVKVVDYNYSRGWFTSRESVTLEVNNQGIKNALQMLPIGKQESSTAISDTHYQFSYTSTITNGVFAGWMHGNLMPTIAYSTTNLVLPDSINKVLKTFFKDKAPLELSTIIYLNNSGKYKLYSSEFNYEEALSGVKVKWDGLKLNISFNSDFNEFSSVLNAPSFAMDAPTKGKFSFENLAYKSDTTRSVNNIKVGDAEFSLGSLDVGLESGIAGDVDFKLGSLINTVVGINSAEFLNDLDVIDSRDIRLSNVRYASQSKEENNYFSAHVLAGFDTLISGKNTYGPLDFDFELDHVRADKFSAVADLLAHEASLSPEEQTAHKPQMIADLKQNMTPVLIESPIARINKLTLKVPSGMINIDGVLTTHGFESSDMNDQNKFISKISAKVNLSVPKPVLSYLLLLQMKYFLSAGNARMDEQSSKALSNLVDILLDNQLKNWLSKGYITQESTNLTTKIDFESGDFMLNNKLVSKMNTQDNFDDNVDNGTDDAE